MARPKSNKPLRKPGSPIRFTEIERDYVEYGIEKQTAEFPGFDDSLAAYVRAAAFERTARLTGETLAEFTARRRPSDDEKA